MGHIENLKEMANAIQQNEQDKKTHCINMFLIGKDLIQNKSTLTMRQIGHIIGLSYVDLSLTKTIAKKFNCDIASFKEYCETELKEFSWKAAKQNLKKHSTHTAGFNTLMDKIHNSHREVIQFIKADIKSTPEKHYLLSQELIKTRNMINRFIPDRPLIVDENFIKYHRCCACGAYPPPAEGFLITSELKKKDNQLKYPVCEDCYIDKVPVDYRIVAEMYSLYALNLEDAINKIIL